MKKMKFLAIVLLSASIALSAQASQLNKLGKQLMVGAGLAGVVTYLAWKMGPQKAEEPLPSIPSSPMRSPALDQLPLDKAQEQHHKDRNINRERKESLDREAQKTLDYGAFLRKISARNSVSHVDVCKQEGAMCGKNAVENGAIYFEFLTRTKRFAGKNQVDAAQLLKELLAQPKVSDDWWREDRVQEEVSRLMSPDQYTVIRNIHNFDPKLVEDPSLFLKSISALRNKSNVAHTFLLGNMQEYLGARGEVRGKNGHWIAVTVAKGDREKSYSYYVLDSFNRDRTEWVQPLQYLVECDDMLTLQLASLEHYLSSAEDKLNNTELRATYFGRLQQEPRIIRSFDDPYRLNGAIDELNKLITTAREFNVLETQAFIEKYNIRIQTIICTIEQRSRIEHIDIHDRLCQLKRDLNILLPSQERKDRGDEKNNV